MTKHSTSTAKISIHEMITTNPYLPVQFKVYEAGNQFVPGHWHAHVEVLLLLEGTMMIGIGEQQYCIHPGDMLLVNSSDIHDTKGIGTIQTILLQIPYDYLDSFISHFELVRFQEFYDHTQLLNHPQFQMMINALYAMQAIYQAHADGYELLFTSYLHQFLHALYVAFRSEPLPTPNSQKYTARLKEILSYINQHYQETITLQDMADKTSLNPEYFCRMFKRYTGTTLLEYINQVRLMHIHDELLHTTDTITDILERNGFSNYKVFSRMFHETYKCTPSALRSQNK